MGNGDRISKGDLVLIPIRLLNRSPELWGEDANEFRYAKSVAVYLVICLDGRSIIRPERWDDDIPDAVKGLPSVYGHLMTFIAGAHACIGYRFSVIEYVVALLSLAGADQLFPQDQSYHIHVGAHIRV